MYKFALAALFTSILGVSSALAQTQSIPNVTLTFTKCIEWTDTNSGLTVEYYNGSDNLGLLLGNSFLLKYNGVAVVAGVAQRFVESSQTSGYLCGTPGYVPVTATYLMRQSGTRFMPVGAVVDCFNFATQTPLSVFNSFDINFLPVFTPSNFTTIRIC